jgi:hypothetical protein
VKLPIVLHIGWARAASTAFRQNFLARHPELVTVGRAQPSSQGPAAYTLQNIKCAAEAEFQQHSGALVADWAGFARGAVGRTICLTDEELSIGLPGTGITPTAIAERCGHLFPHGRVVAIVRNQVDAIRSLYGLSQTLDRQGRIPLSAWVRKHFLEPEPGRGATHLFEHETTLRAYAAWCARRDMLVIPYERLAATPGGVYAEVAGWLGITMEPGLQFPNGRVNVSPRDLQDEYAPGQEEQIRALFARDNEALRREFGIALCAA